MLVPKWNVCLVKDSEVATWNWRRIGFSETGTKKDTFITKHKSYFLTKLNSVALVRERTIPTERPPPVGEVSAHFCG